MYDTHTLKLDIYVVASKEQFFFIVKGTIENNKELQL